LRRSPSCHTIRISREEKDAIDRDQAEIEALFRRAVASEGVLRVVLIELKRGKIKGWQFTNG
jgi:hypothetical protein